MAEVIYGFSFVTGGILDRTADQSGGRRQSNRFRYRGGRIAETVLEIGGNREIRRGNDHLRHLQHFFTRKAMIQSPKRGCGSTARCGKRLETRLRQYPRRASIPRIRNDERTRCLMKVLKTYRFFVLAYHRRLLKFRSRPPASTTTKEGREKHLRSRLLPPVATISYPAGCARTR